MSDLVERLRAARASLTVHGATLHDGDESLYLLAADEIDRLRGGLQLIADDTHRLMNEVARQTAASILNGKPIGATVQPNTSSPLGQGVAGSNPARRTKTALEGMARAEVVATPGTPGGGASDQPDASIFRTAGIIDEHGPLWFGGMPPAGAVVYVSRPTDEPASRPTAIDRAADQLESLFAMLDTIADAKQIRSTDQTPAHQPSACPDCGFKPTAGGWLRCPRCDAKTEVSNG